jgi:lysophospholipase L1-like esterase
MRHLPPTALLLALLAATALACGAASTSPARPTVAVAVLGSSTAFGTGATTGNGWVERVRVAAATACPKLVITNLAVGGTTTRDGLPASPGVTPLHPNTNLDAALALKPALVFVEYPSNDAFNLIPLAETLANHATLRDGIRAAGAIEVIIGPFPRTFPAGTNQATQNILMTGLRDQLPAVGAPRYLALWADLAFSDTQVSAPFAYNDGIHLSDAGHALIATKVLASDAWKSVCTP